MTTSPRILETPRVESQATPSRATTRAIHAFTLADLCDDASAGHPAQRLTFGRCVAGTYHGFYQPTKGAAYLVLRACVLRTGTYSPGDGVTYDLSITDGTTTVLSSNAKIPAGLKADLTYYPGLVGLGTRFGGGAYLEWYLSLADLVGLGLSTSVPWRFTLVVTCGATVVSELFQMEECPRFLVDTADALGQLPQDYLPRGQIVDGTNGTERMLTTLREAHYSGLRTYHQMSRPEASPWTTTSATYALWLGDSEAGTTPAKWRERVRLMRAAAANGARFRWIVRYKIVGAAGADKGFVRINTGGGSSPYVITLTDITGAWADSPVGDGYLANNASGAIDTFYFEAKVDAGTLSLSARAVWDYPA